MHSLLDTLDKNKLNNPESIYKAIMNDWSSTKVEDLRQQLYESIELSAHPIPSNLSHKSDYSFIPNANLTSRFNAGCFMWECRVNRIDQLARFSTLYADKVYLPNYFDDYSNINITQDKAGDEYFRFCMAGDLVLINHVRVLLEAGIMGFLPTLMLVCKHENKKLKQIEKKILSNIDLCTDIIEDSLLENTSIIIEKLIQPIDGKKYCISITSGEETINGTYFHSYELPGLLNKDTKLKKSNFKKVKLTKQQMKESEVINLVLHKQLTNMFEHKFQQFLKPNNLKYLTNSNLEITALDLLSDSPRLQEYNNILRSQICFEIPFIKDIPLRELIKIREREQDAFINYRNTIANIEKNYIDKKQPLSVELAKEIYEDEIKPNIDTLKLRIKAIQEHHKKSAVRNLIISSALSFGLYCIPEARQVSLSAMISGAVTVVNSILNTVSAPDEIKDDKFYLLWKIANSSQTHSTHC